MFDKKIPVIGSSWEHQEGFITEDKKFFKMNNETWNIDKFFDENTFGVSGWKNSGLKYVKYIDGFFKFYNHNKYIKNNDIKYEDNEKIIEDIQKYSCVLTMNHNRWSIFESVKSTYTDLKFNRYTGKPDKNAIRSCRNNHIDMIRYAKQNDWPFILIFEDDVVGRIDWFDHIVSVFKNIPDDAAMIHLGEHQFSNGDPFKFYKNDYFHMHKSKNVWGTHAYLVFKNYYDMVIQYFNTVRAADSIYNINALRNLVYIVNTPIFVQCYNDNCEHIHNGHTTRGSETIHYGISNGVYRDVLDGFPDLRNIRTK